MDNATGNWLFDSLATALAISDTVKRIYRYYLQWGRLRREVQAGWENRSALKSAGQTGTCCNEMHSGLLTPRLKR